MKYIYMYEICIYVYIYVYEICINMLTTQFQILFKKIENVIQKRNTNFRRAITSIEKLAIYLILACL